jgi:hypothetical protein
MLNGNMPITSSETFWAIEEFTEHISTFPVEV